MISRFNPSLGTMQMNQDEWRDLVDEFGRAQDAEFPFRELLDYARKQGCKGSEEELYDLAATSEYLFEPLEDTGVDLLVPRRAFFQGAQFRITPLKEELDGGFIVPGHRFFPFVSREVFPPDARLVLPDGSALRTRTVSIPQVQAMACLLFYGSSHSFEYLLLDHEGNAPVLKPPFDGKVKLTAFDLRDFFAESGFRLGDSLMLTVVDWLQGVFSVARAEAATDLVSSQKWVDSMQMALDDAMDELKTTGDCHEQLALAVYNAQNDPNCIPLTKAPPLSFAAYLNQQRDITVKMVGEQGLFWEVDEDPAMDAAMEALANPSEPDSELDAYFQQLGLSISEGEAEAYMRDALYHGCKNPEEVLARVAAGRSLFFASSEEQEEFHDLWSMLWDELRRDYSRKDDICAKARAKFLAINDKCFAAMRQLDERGTGMEIVENPAFMEFGKLTSMISSALVMFNAPEMLGESPDDLGEMTEMLEAAIDDLTGRLASGGAASSIYQLKVSLKGAKPPIWRRILVSSDMELVDLHHAIQSTMGWYNCHLHQFKLGRTFFQPDPDPEFMGFGGFETEDSAGVRICDLLRSEKEKIDYEYDFGDSWEHVVLLEKITKPEEGQAYPVCIKGKRACPPEDCGGLWGYCNLLEILENPKDEEYEGMLEWVGGKIDPEAFDLAEANARLKRYF